MSTPPATLRDSVGSRRRRLSPRRRQPAGVTAERKRPLDSRKLGGPRLRPDGRVRCSSRRPPRAAPRVEQRRSRRKPGVLGADEAAWIPPRFSPLANVSVAQNSWPQDRLRMSWGTRRTLARTPSERPSKLWLRGPDRPLRGRPGPRRQEGSSPGRGRARTSTATAIGAGRHWRTGADDTLTTTGGSSGSRCAEGFPWCHEPRSEGTRRPVVEPRCGR